MEFHAVGRPKKMVPDYRYHVSGQAVVTFNGVNFYRAASHNILDFCARVPARKAELGPGSHSESRPGTANRCLLG